MSHPPRCLASLPLLPLVFLACSESDPAPGAGVLDMPGSSGGVPGADPGATGGASTEMTGGGAVASGGAVGNTGGTSSDPSGTGGGLAGEATDGDPFSVFYRGASLSGAEHGIENDGSENWGDATPGAEGSQYAWPNPDTNPEMDEVDLFLDRGMNFYRLPIAWERIQQTLFGPLDPDYLGRLKETVEAIRSRGATILIDVHNYARYKSQDLPDTDPSPIIGSTEVPASALSDLWGKMAMEFGEVSRTSPIWFDIMNEPHDIDAEVWASAANGAIVAIRDAGAKNVILVPPVQWGTAWDFSWHEGMQTHTQDIIDPLDNFAIQVHQYSHGDGPDCATDPNDFITLVGPAEDWARAHDRKLFLGEFNASQQDACLPAIDALLSHLETERWGEPSGVWIGWSVWAINARGTWTELENDDGSEGHMTATVMEHLPATCGDAMVDGEETDVDCGGSCRRCSEAQICATGNDCRSGACASGVCQ